MRVVGSVFLCLLFIIVVSNCKSFLELKESAHHELRTEGMMVQGSHHTGSLLTSVLTTSLLRKGLSIRIGHFTLGFNFANFWSFHSVEVTEKNIFHIMKANIWVPCQGGASSSPPTGTNPPKRLKCQSVA
jgi:hypothetical protein